MNLKETIEAICKCETLEDLKVIEKEVSLIQDNKTINIKRGQPISLKKGLEDTITQQRKRILLNEKRRLENNNNIKETDVPLITIERHENQERMGLIECGIIDIKTKLQTDKFTEDELLHLLILLRSTIEVAGGLYDRDFSKKPWEV